MTNNDMVVELQDCSFIENIFRIHLRHIIRFFGAYLVRAQIQYLKSSLIVHFGGMILRIGFIKIIINDKKSNKISTVN